MSGDGEQGAPDFVAAQHVPQPRRPVGSWMWHRSRNSVGWSDGLFHILGLSPGSVAPTEDALLQRVHVDDRARLALALEHARDGRAHGPIEVRMVRTNHEVRDVVIDLAPTQLDVAGRVERFVATVLDITDARIGTRANHNALELLEHSQRVGALGSFRWNVGTNAFSTSAGLRTLLGLRPEFEPTLALFESLVDARDVARFRHMRNEVVRTPSRSTIELRIDTPDGGHRTLLIEGNPWIGAMGEVVGVVGTCLDVTQQRELRRQLESAQRMEALGRLASGVAHDFNNVLSVVMAEAEVLMCELDDPRLEEIVQAVQSGAALTRQLLMLARELPTTRRPCNLNYVISEVLHLMQRVLGDDMRIRLIDAPDLRSVVGDAVQLRQIVMNLAVNARDAMPNGGVLTLETENQVEPGPNGRKWVALSVRDTGVGMAADVVERIFDPFFSTKPANVGTGLGLAMVAEIVRAHDGQIEVESKPGLGTTFHIRLPASELSPRPASQAPLEAATGRGERILLVEDNPRLRTTLRDCLANAGYRVLVASNRADALQKVATARDGIDMLITDMEMPAGSGASLGSQLRLVHPHLPILYISGRTVRAPESNGEPTGFLLKPFRRAQFLADVRRLLLQPRQSG